jgi:transposase InsO family protein
VRQRAIELHAPYSVDKNTRHVVTKGKDDVWAADTLHLFNNSESIVEENRGYGYVLVVLDCFTRFAWAIPMKSVNAVNAWTAFNSILRSSERKPESLWVDQGSEFVGGNFSKNLKDNDITMYHTYNQGKSVMAERLIRTIREKLGPLMTMYETKRWIDLLPQIMHDYNYTDIHSTIQMTPYQASNLDPSRSQLLWFHQYVHNHRVGPKYQVGDWVRIWHGPGRYTKKSMSRRWQDEKFVVAEVRTRTNPVTYRIKGTDGDVIIGSYYEHELRPTASPSVDP